MAYFKTKLKQNKTCNVTLKKILSLILTGERQC